MNKSNAQERIDAYKEVQGLRSNFETYWQTLHDYFYVEAGDINTQYSPGNELNSSYLWDSTTLEAADISASGFMNYLTPPGSKWFRLGHKNPTLTANKAVASWLEDVASEVQNTLNRSNFYNEVMPMFKSSIVYGTSCMLVEEDLEDEARFYNLPIKQLCIVEDGRGRVEKYYIEFEYTAQQAAGRFGKENLSIEMQRELEKPSESKKHPFLLYIGKRVVRDIRKTNKENMPVEASWIDVTANKTVLESGYHEFPAMTHRFDKRSFIAYGFSPAMKSLPSARLLNAIAKTNLRAMMKLTDPPIAVPDNAFLMPFNANPKSVNIYNRDKMSGGAKDIFAFANYGNPQVGMAALEYYANQVKSLMFNDVFLAFDQITKQMNNPEVAERINEKMTLLGPAVGRATSEVLDPIITRVIGILWRRGKLPPPPDEIMEDPTYEIRYVSKLAQAQKMTELTSLMSAINITAQMAQYVPEVLDNVDADKTVNEVWDVTGATVKVLRTDEEIENIRAGRAEQQQQMQQAMMQEQGANTVKNASAADLNLAKARKE